MDEEIDIEEHDVFDNPKIRNIFPDLSCVKIEAPDVCKEDQYDSASAYRPEENVPIAVKMETLSEDQEEDFTLTYEHSSDSHSDECHEEDRLVANCDRHEQAHPDLHQFKDAVLSSMDRDDIYQHHNRNRIILGSKPSTSLDYDKLYEEAFHSKVNVVLQNWDMILKNSACYCQHCEILFATVNALDSHKSLSHSLLVARESPTTNTQTKSTARKSTVKFAYCDHCNRKFPDHASVIKHLYKLLPLNKFKTQTPAPVKVEAKFTQYKCIKCKIYFKTFSEGTEHKRTCHPNFKINNVICKVQRCEPLTNTDSNVDGNNVPKKMPAKGRLVANSSLVPRSVLFQCNKCLVAFLSCYSAMQHRKTCENKTEFVQCNICKRKIRRLDFSTHEMQHNHNDKLKIYTLNKNLTQKIIAKCPTCSVCFDETLFWYHRKSCDGKKNDFIHCNICSLDINSLRYQHHKSLHRLKKYTKKDFILVEFLVKSKLHDPADEAKSEGVKIPLYFCETCGSCKTIRSLKGHKNGACKSLPVKFCDTCLLGFGKQQYKLHRLTHDKAHLSVHHFDIFSLWTGERMQPPLLEFNKCHTCHIYFLCKVDTNHDCEIEQFKVCKICNKKFNLVAFKPHMSVHNYEGQNDESDMDMPELLKMYDSINTKWDIVYKCMECKLFTVTYDSAVEHSQTHIYGAGSVTSHHRHVTCHKCGFNIAEKDFTMHNDLHKNNSNINRKQFRVLKFNYKHLYKKEWMNIFLPLPSQDKEHILAKSIYRCTRRLKLHCEIDCLSDDAKFYCKTCKTSVNIEDIKGHYFDRQCQFSSNYVCKLCNLTFKTILHCVSHESKHDKLTKLYKVYSFNDENDKEFNKKLLDFDSSSRVKSRMKPLPIACKSSLKKFVMKSKITSAANKFKIFKCERCESCVSIAKNMSKHKCNTRKKACHICKNYFYPRNLTHHVELHRFGKKPSIVYFNPRKNETVPKAIIYKCECGLHFTSKQSIENHLSVCSDTLDISKESCSKCHLLFPTDLLVTHLCKHHSKVTPIEIIDTSKACNFTCGNCNIAYPNRVTFDDHLFKCPVKSGKKCNRCNLKFDLKTEHRCGSNEVIVTKCVITSKLVKCNQCDLHYFNNKNLLYHIAQKHVCYRKIVACDICKLRFTESGITKHLMIHEHKEKRYMIKIEDGAGGYHLISGQNNTSNVTNDVNQVYSLKSNVTSETFVSKLSVKRKVETERSIMDSSTTNSIITSTVYKCSSCNICYHFKKSWSYHIKVKHVNRRGAIPCGVCGLRFTKNSLTKHTPVHENSKDYWIRVIDVETGISTAISGKNDATIKPVFRDNSPVRKKIKQVDDIEESRESKLDYECFDMIEDESDTVTADVLDEHSNDFNGSDALMASDIALVGVLEHETIDTTKKSPLADTSISSKLKSLINANIDSYTDTIYKCDLCSICFLTQQAIDSHFKRTSHGSPPKCTKCNVCGLAFTHLTLLRHKYVHHEKMKFNLESFNVITVSANNFKLYSNDSNINLYEFDTRQDVENVTCDNDTKDDTEEVDMDLDGDIQTGTVECHNVSANDNGCRERSKYQENSDTEMRIRCKICNYQFQLMETVGSISHHVMVEHNKKFSLEDIVSTEYRSRGKHNDRDKVQSRLITTTSDVTAE